MTAGQQAARALRTFGSDVASGFFEICHSGLALVGVTVILALATLATRPDLRQEGETRLIAPRVERSGDEPDGADVEEADQDEQHRHHPSPRAQNALAHRVVRFMCEGQARAQART